MKSPYEYEYYLEVEDESIDKVSVTVHFCNIFNTDDLFGMHKFLSVRITPTKKLLFRAAENAPFKHFIVTQHKKYTNAGVGVEINEQEFNKLILGRNLEQGLIENAYEVTKVDTDSLNEGSSVDPYESLKNL